MKIKVYMQPNNALLRKRGLEKGGKVQQFIDSECLRLMNPLTPRRNGVLIDSATAATKIGSGKIKYNAPYARYQYYGKLMVSPTTGSAYAKFGEQKVLTDRNLHYTGEPQRGSLWFERMKSKHKKKLLNRAKKIAGGDK